MPATRTLLLVHAFPVGRRMWDDQLDRFPGWQVLTPSFPGFDGTAPVATPSMEAYADAALGALDAAGASQAVVAGVSMGGYGAFALLRRAPGQVAGLVLADTRSGADSEEARAGRHRMLASLESGGVAAVAADMLPKLLGRTTRDGNPDIVARVRAMILAQSRSGIEAAVRGMMTRPDSTPMLASIRIPAMVIVGAEDTVTPPAEAEGLQRAIPGATLVRIPGAGHLSNLEQPGLFNDAVGRLLSSF